VFEIFGKEIRLLFFKQEDGIKLLLTVALVLLLMVLRWVARGISRLVQRARFWTLQAINLAFALLLLLGILSICFVTPPGWPPAWVW